MMTRAVLFALSVSAILAGTTRAHSVTQGCGTAQPAVGGRSSHSLAYDTARGKVVMFGGVSDNRLDQFPSSLWEWDGARWACIAPSGPSGRMDAFLAYDSTRKRLVLFGGRRIGADRAQQHYLDTWEWDGRAWAKLDEKGPGPRVHGAVSFDPDRQSVVINGGGDGEDMLSDTWEWKGTRWSAVPAKLPKGTLGDAMMRTSHGTTLLAAASDDAPECKGLNRAVLYALRGNSIVDLASPGPCFSPLAPASATATGLLMYAGWNGPNTQAESWTWSAGKWQRAATAPSRRRGTATAYDARRQRVVLFGGEDDGGLLNDTWEWDGTAWRRIG
ncbi:MAG TPA: hypothetical protein VMZ90_01305 [Vicinamibacterales bacterium]|nr:hypothetical protein [Vicinamibacterales bacterium]